MAAEKNQFMFYLELLKKSEFPISFHGEILRGQNAKDMIKILTLSLNIKATKVVICDILNTKAEVDDEDLDFLQLWNASKLRDLHEQLMKSDPRQNEKSPVDDTDLSPSAPPSYDLAIQVPTTSPPMTIKDLKKSTEAFFKNHKPQNEDQMLDLMDEIPMILHQIFNKDYGMANCDNKLLFAERVQIFFEWTFSKNTENQEKIRNFLALNKLFFENIFESIQNIKQVEIERRSRMKGTSPYSLPPPACQSRLLWALKSETRNFLHSIDNASRDVIISKIFDEKIGLVASETPFGFKEFVNGLLSDILLLELKPFFSIVFDQINEILHYGERFNYEKSFGLFTGDNWKMKTISKALAEVSDVEELSTPPLDLECNPQSSKIIELNRDKNGFGISINPKSSWGYNKKKKFKVTEVKENSPASKMNVKKGDKLIGVEINGIDLSDLSHKKGEKLYKKAEKILLKY